MSNLTDRDGEDLVFDLDVLRGWKEVRDENLRTDHILPPVAHLICRHPDGGVRHEFAIHGPETYIGRYHPQNGPVDLILSGMTDHEVYKLSAPHVRIVMSDRGDWSVRPMTPAAHTELNGTVLVDTRKQYTLRNEDRLMLGAVEFEVRASGVTYDEWLGAKKDILLNEDETCIFLMRAGGICGPSIVAPKGARIVLGRSFPRKGDLSLGPWRGEEQPDWNLAGLYEWERRFIGFRHAALVQVDEQWYIEPISQRQRTFVNRVEISGTTPLMPGDEIGLGSVLFHFHDPSDIRASTESHTAELPAVVDWREEHTDPRVEPISGSNTYAAIRPDDEDDEDDDPSEGSSDSDASPDDSEPDSDTHGEPDAGDES